MFFSFGESRGRMLDVYILFRHVTITDDVLSSALAQQKLDFKDNKLSSSRQSVEMKTTNEEATEKLLEVSIKFTDIFEPIMIKAEAN